MDRRLEVAIKAAEAGGAVALKYFGTNVDVEEKADHSPVTIADRESERRIIAVLRESFPDYGVLGEESGEQKGVGARWIIDPIDGTKSFVRRSPLFATLLALEEDGEITTGVIHAPAMNDLIYAQKGQGAFDRRGRIHVSQIDTVARSMLVFGGPSVLRAAGEWEMFERLVDRSARQRAYGDFYGYTFTARGYAEATIDVDLKPWDLAALKIIVEEAGGRFTDFAGKPTIYTGSALASNGLVHDALLELMNA